MLCNSISRVRKAKCSIGWYFCMLGAVIGNWSALIPTILVSHQISDAVLGGILVSGIAGAILAAPISTFCIGRYGSGFSSVCGLLLLICMMTVIGIPSGIWLLAIGITLQGFGMGWTDVSLNSQAMLCEKFGGRSTIGFFHAAYAAGALIGVLYGGALVQLGVSALNIFAFFAIVTILPSVLMKYWLFSYEEEKGIEDREKLSGIDNDIFMTASTDDIDVLIDPEYRARSTAEFLEMAANNVNSANNTSNRDDRSRCDSGTGVVGTTTASSDEKTANETDTRSTLSRLEQNSFLGGANLNHINNQDDIVNSVLESRISDENIVDPESEKERSKKDKLMLMILCFLGGLAYIGEGSIGDWSTVYLVIELKSSPLVGVLGFALFQLVVCIARYSSDTIVEIIDRKLLLQIAGCLACFGLGVVGLAPSLPPTYMVPCAIVGFAICGGGISVVAPLVIYFAGTSIKSLEPSQAIATVASASYMGLIIGPPLFGGLAEALKGLRWSLLLDGFCMLFIFFLACFLPSVTPGSERTRT